MLLIYCLLAAACVSVLGHGGMDNAPLQFFLSRSNVDEVSAQETIQIDHGMDMMGGDYTSVGFVGKLIVCRHGRRRSCEKRDEFDISSSNHVVEMESLGLTAKAFVFRVINLDRINTDYHSVALAVFNNNDVLNNDKKGRSSSIVNFYDELFPFKTSVEVLNWIKTIGFVTTTLVVTSVTLHDKNHDIVENFAHWGNIDTGLKLPFLDVSIHRSVVLSSIDDKPWLMETTVITNNVIHREIVDSTTYPIEDSRVQESPQPLSPFLEREITVTENYYRRRGSNIRNMG